MPRIWLHPSALHFRPRQSLRAFLPIRTEPAPCPGAQIGEGPARVTEEQNTRPSLMSFLPSCPGELVAKGPRPGIKGRGLMARSLAGVR